MIPEDLKPEEYDRLRELATLKVLWEALDAARKKVDLVIWIAERGYEGEAFLLALESGEWHPLLRKWKKLNSTVAANRPAPDPLVRIARRLTVLMVETLCRAGLGKGIARERAAEAVKRFFPKKLKRRKGDDPSILVDIDADAIRNWETEYPPFTPEDETLIAGAIKDADNDSRHIVGWFVELMRFVLYPATNPKSRQHLSSALAVNPHLFTAQIS